MYELNKTLAIEINLFIRCFNRQCDHSQVNKSKKQTNKFLYLSISLKKILK